MAHSLSQAIESLKQQFESIDVANVDELLALYAPDAYFKDPFNQVVGRQEIKRIFLKMFEQLNDPQFIVLDVLQKDHLVCFHWEFEFQFKRWDTTTKRLRGVSWLEFNAEHLVSSHTDYWDPAEGIYEHLPLIGAFMKGLKKLA